MKPRVLVLTGVYLPGYLSGGPVRSLANIVSQLADEFDWRVLTADRDRGSTSAYAGVQVNRWNQVGAAKVCYLSPTMRSFGGAIRFIRTTPHELLYLNSFFDPVFSIMPIWARRVRILPQTPVLLAPRGEFSDAALEIKRRRKWFYAKVARGLSVAADLTWHASTTVEAHDIRRNAEVAESRILVARDLSNPLPSTRFEVPEIRSDNHVLGVCFLSRISPMKNLDFALRVLALVSKPVRFSVYGPKQDGRYWRECEQLIEALPSRVQVDVMGAVPSDQVSDAIAQHDLFFVPSRGENFGHVFLEALSVGVPILTSDQTPWRNLQQSGVGWDLSLEDPGAFARVVDDAASWSLEQRVGYHERCGAYAARILRDDEAVEANRRLFWQALGSESGGLA